MRFKGLRLRFQGLGFRASGGGGGNEHKPSYNTDDADIYIYMCKNKHINYYSGQLMVLKPKFKSET